jgi:hypothetical protein
MVPSLPGVFGELPLGMSQHFGIRMARMNGNSHESLVQAVEADAPEPQDSGSTGSLAARHRRLVTEPMRPTSNVQHPTFQARLLPPSPPARTARLAMVLELLAVLAHAPLLLAFASVAVPRVARSIERHEFGVRERTLQLVL